MHTTSKRPGKIIKATRKIDVQDIPLGHKVAEPTGRIDMKSVPYETYKEFVEECNKEYLTFRQLFVKMWKVYIKSKKKGI